MGSYQHAAAQTTTVSVTAFNAKVNLMDSLIGAGSMTAAQATWNDVHDMMIAELSVTKASIAGAATATDRASYMTVMNNQRSLYDEVWGLKSDLATNRTALRTKLNAFAATF
jgi:hypothetical protein